MKIIDLINILSSIKDKEGNIDVCYRISDDYWGWIDGDIEEHDICCQEARPDGPKSTRKIKAVILRTT